MRGRDRQAMIPVSTAEYDYVVVGGGTAGCVLAARLAADSDGTVLLIEAGPDGRGVAQIPDPALWAKLRGTSLDWALEYAPSALVAGRPMAVPRGKVLGGCSATNAMVWSRGQPADYDAWEGAGAAGWNFTALLPYFRRAEDWEGGQGQLRGEGGPLRIERPRDPHPVAAALLDAAAELGLPVLDDANGGESHGAALTNLNIAAGRRHSVVDGYLRAPGRGCLPGLTVLTGSAAVRLGFSGSRCDSVFHVVRGALRQTRARREVIVTLGALGTPRLLIRSGIGDPGELARLGVAVQAALPGVGANLQDHPFLAGITFRARRRIGLVRDNGGGAVLSWCSSRASRPDLHAFAIQGSGDSFSIAPALVGSRSAGYLRVHALSGDGADHAQIQPNFLAEPSDTKALAESLDMIMDLAGTRAYRARTAAPLRPPGRLTHADKVRYIRENCATLGDPCGTAAIGTGPGAVVDPALRVIGVDGLRVADASVIPVIPRCNIQAPVVAIAERAADLVIGA